MKQRRLVKAFVITVLGLGLASLGDPPVFAQSLQIQPLLYRESFKPGEVKKGFINVSNGGAAKVTLVTEVQAFKQLDSKGNLQFFDSPQIARAVTPDLKEFELGPREALRLYFAVDSKKLPGGDNFAALFVRTKGDAKNGIASNVRVGTLLVMENGRPGPRQASIQSLSAGFFQWGKGAALQASVKNTADPAKNTAFFPEVTATLKPLGGSTSVNQPPGSPLIFAGITRDVPLQIPANLIGLYRLDVTAGQNTQSKWVFLVTGWWRWVVIIAAILLPVAVSSWWLRRSKRRQFN